MTSAAHRTANFLDPVTMVPSPYVADTVADGVDYRPFGDLVLCGVNCQTCVSPQAALVA